MEGDFTDLFDDVKAVKLVSKVHRCIIPVKQTEEKKPFFWFWAKTITWDSHTDQWYPVPSKII